MTHRKKIGGFLQTYHQNGDRTERLLSQAKTKGAGQLTSTFLSAVFHRSTLGTNTLYKLQLNIQRRRMDSNHRYLLQYGSFQDCCNKPTLPHLHRHFCVHFRTSWIKGIRTPITRPSAITKTRGPECPIHHIQTDASNHPAPS